MAERDGYIPGVPCWVDTTQPDPEAAAAFYGSLFGWEVEDAMPPGSEMHYYVGRIRGGDVAAISSISEGAPPMALWNTYVWVDSADHTAAKVLGAGGSVVMDPFDVMDAGRMAVFADPEGAAFCVWQANRHRGARVVNEHGALNFNGLNTRDPEAAKSFYGSVFGWETLTLNGGAEMWTLPGYGDYLERHTPGLRKMVMDVGAPERFVDVVASIMPLPADHDDVPAHWSVTFAVDDADGIAQRAVELGGKVLAGPLDAPWVRMAIISDPQGATFIASKFVAENKDLLGSADTTASPA
jgi:predicted enzyme related to lactoylglutathione lyase